MNNKKLRYAILMNISKGNSELTEETFGVDQDTFDDAIRFLTCENYLKGVFYADDRPRLEKIGPELTEKGEHYLKENNALSKTYKGLKEIRNWLKP